MNDPQPISTAPVDGTVILTNVGFVRAWSWPGSRIWWATCDRRGSIYERSDGTFICDEPTLWTPVPEWIR